MTDAPDASRDPRDPQLQRLLEALRRFAPPFSRYLRVTEVGCGAMGVVDQVTDQLLERSVALKSLRVREGSAAEHEKRLRRFLFEARVTGNLDHPAIVAVHDIGIDEAGTPYFAMKLVRGEPLSQSFERCARGEDAWTLPRLVGVLQRVCEAMSYAHQKGVLHRDLKPSNVMVGRFGEVYVMDWGLARSLDAPDENDIRVSAQEPATEQIDDIDADEELRTVDGDIIGTPAYMPPEQAHGRISQMGPHSDIYSVGAMLYHLLAGHMPYVPKFSRVGVHTLFLWVREGPPTDLATLAPAAPPELVAICNKAMAREPSQRFASMDELADELRRYIEGRVVRSHRTGPIIELRKWARRNRVAAVAAGVAVLATMSGVVVAHFQQREVQAAQGMQLERYATRECLATFDTLGPIHPNSIPRFDHWLLEADRLSAALPEHARRLAELRASLVADDQATLPLNGEEDDESGRADYVVRELEKFLKAERSASAEPSAARHRSISILEHELDVWRARASALQLAQQANEIERALTGAPAGARELASLVADQTRIATIAAPLVRLRLDAARRLRTNSVERFAMEWAEATNSIRDAKECPAYAGLQIAPQLGLAPIGRDPRSGLWEFWHVLSGEAPQRSPDGALIITERTAIVLVLIPGGLARLGAQANDPSEPRFDPKAKSNEELREVELSAFFISKYELTQAQWFRATGEIPSERFAGMDFGRGRLSAVHPVERVSGEEAQTVLQRWNLELPTEAQWEYAARAGSDHRLTPSEDARALAAYINFSDKSIPPAARDDSLSILREPPAESIVISMLTDDGWPYHAPVGTFAPNDFGLHEVLGNVAEWCRDEAWIPGVEVTTRPGDGLRKPDFSQGRAYRGGSFRDHLASVRITAAFGRASDSSEDNLGVRPVRSLDVSP